MEESVGNSLYQRISNKIQAVTFLLMVNITDDIDDQLPTEATYF